MVSRSLAVLLAVALVVGALIVRDRFIEGDEVAADGPPTNDDGGDVPLGDDPVRLVCATELEPVCDELSDTGEGGVAVEVADVAETVENLSGDGDADVDAWLTLAPWPQMAREARERAGLQPVLGDDRPPLARSPLQFAVWTERATVLDSHCGGAFDWECLGEVAPGTWADIGGQTAWGPVKPGHADPSQTAAGLLVLAQAAASRAGTSDLSTRTFEDPGFFSWFTGLERAVGAFGLGSGTPLEQMLLTGPSTFDVAGVIEAEAVPQLEGSRRSAELERRTAEPAMTADVVVVGVGDRGAAAADLVAERTPELLATHAWRADGATLDPRLDAVDLPDGNGLPSPGAMEALRTTWLEVVQ